MTTERAPAVRARAVPVNELKLYASAALALVYILSWWGFGLRTPKAPTSLPVSDTFQSRLNEAFDRPPEVTRVVPSHAQRLRTRSS